MKECWLASGAVRALLLQLHLPRRPAAQEPLAHKKRRVEELLEMLALQGCSNSYIGDVLAKGISGGQAGRPPVHDSCHLHGTASANPMTAVAARGSQPMQQGHTAVPGPGSCRSWQSPDPK